MKNPKSNPPIKATEQSPIEFGERDDLREWLSSHEMLNAKNRADSARLLGCHKTAAGIAPGNFVGAIWIGEGENRAPLESRSKFHAEKMNYLAMYLACAADSEVGGHLRDCVYFWPDDDLIEFPNAPPQFSEFIIAAYLRELNALCTRHLRRHFIRQTENLHGKIKGKILPHLQVKHNLPHGRQDRIFCAYQSVSDDIPENRALRAALEVSAKCLACCRAMQPPSEEILRRWIHASRASLSGVMPIIALKDFHHLRNRGAFFHYRRPLELARIVLRHWGANPAEIRETPNLLPPFAINSAELFERYAQLILRKEYPTLKAGYKYGNTHGDKEGFSINVRPDFWIAKSDDSHARIFDAKYKRRRESKPPDNKDVYQVVAYSRHSNFLKNKLNCDDKGEIKLKLVLVYPRFGQESESGIVAHREDKSFIASITEYPIFCPQIPEAGEND